MNNKLICLFKTIILLYSKNIVFFLFFSDDQNYKKIIWNKKSCKKEFQINRKIINYIFYLLRKHELKIRYAFSFNKNINMLIISQHHLSQVINEKMKQNFLILYSYRINEAKKLLIDLRGQLLTIFAVAVEVGFNSKSSFNTAFKKISGITPTEYKKSLSSEFFQD